MPLRWPREPRQLERLRQAAWDRRPNRDVLLEIGKRRDARGRRRGSRSPDPTPDDPSRTELWLQPLPEGKLILIGS